MDTKTNDEMDEPQPDKNRPTGRDGNGQSEPPSVGSDRLLSFR